MINLKEIVTKTRLTFVLGLIATTVVSKFNTAMAAIAALTASSIGFTGTGADGNGFAAASDNVEKALIELMQKSNAADVDFETLQNPNTGKLKTYRFTKGTGAGAKSMDIDIEKDLLNGTFELVTIVEGTGDDAGKYFDGATEVGSSVGVTGAGVYMKYNVNAAGEAASYNYSDMSNCIEYLTVGDQTGKMVTLTIDPVAHTITADIADGTLTEAKLASALQLKIDNAAQILDVNNIKALTNAQCEALRAGDIVNKVDATGKHAYTVSFKTSTGLCLTYSDCENIETVAYEKANDSWAWDSTDVTSIGTALHQADFDEISEADCSAAWTAAMAAAEAAANANS